MSRRPTLAATLALGLFVAGGAGARTWLNDRRRASRARASRATGRRLAIGLTSIVVMELAAASSAQNQPAPQLANPASVRCVEKGGTLRIERRPDGGQYGVCVFVDDYQCEEWALFRGECPAGGLRVTGYITAAARYCAITGGRYTVMARSGSADEAGSCALPGGKTCNADALYAGTCSR